MKSKVTWTELIMWSFLSFRLLTLLAEYNQLPPDEQLIK